MNIAEKIKTDLKRVLGELQIEASVQVENSKDDKFGDYSSNVAMKVGAGNPMEVGERIKSALEAQKLDYVGKIEVIEPGFINFHLKQDFLITQVDQLLKTPEKLDMTGQTYLVEYTDANPFKEMHIGHLYSNIVGESLSRILEFQGNEVKRLCYQGDIGLHVAKAIYGMKRKLENAKVAELEKEPLEAKVKFLGESYALGASDFEDKPEAKSEIIELNKKIYAKDPEVMDLYEKGRAWSLEKFDQIYARLGTKFDKLYFESEVAEEGVRIVKEHVKDGIFEESEGALIFNGEKYGLHKRVFVNSLGLPTYEAKELALMEEKAKDFKFDVSIIVTALEVADYFKVLFQVISLIHPEFEGRMKHVGHGFVKLPEGKMSSRSGNVLTAQWLMDEAVLKVQKEFADMDAETSEKVGIGAVKYSLLKNTIGKNVVFNFDESISLEGNSGPYLQYTYVRCLSVLSKNGGEITELNGNVVSSEEEALLKKLAKFDSNFRFTKDFSQSTLCTYLYELASIFNLFYQRNQIISGENRDFRLGLTKATSEVLKTGLLLLGIEAPTRM